jgi:ribosomal protein L31
MRKRDIHPEWYPEAKVFCNGVEVMTVGGTKETYNVDVYSGNHPFYQVRGTQLGLEECARTAAAAAPGSSSNRSRMRVQMQLMLQHSLLASHGLHCGDGDGRSRGASGRLHVAGATPALRPAVFVAHSLCQYMA